MRRANDHYAGALLEAINDQLKGIGEGVDALLNVPQRLTSLEDKVDGLTNESKAVQAAIKDFSSQVNKHQVRLSRLETA